ncbi:MAG TPA: hypothetical protein VGI86_17270 [Acidimicrobiia bacterium]
MDDDELSDAALLVLFALLPPLLHEAATTNAAAMDPNRAAAVHITLAPYVRDAGGRTRRGRSRAS